MTGRIKYYLTRLQLVGVISAVRQQLWLTKRRVRKTDYLIAKAYFAQHDIPKLHLGCGDHLLEGWLNADLFPRANAVLHLDATKILPFQDNTFDYIFSEHMIEHVTYRKGTAMLAECYRVLKNNGIIRVATPDLQFLIDLYRKDKTELQMKYIEYATDTFITGAPYYDEAFVINNFVRDWGHLFIYDKKTLRASMERAGFTNIIDCELNESAHDALRHLANEERLPEGFLRLETFVLEGTKLSAGEQVQSIGSSARVAESPAHGLDLAP